MIDDFNWSHMEITTSGTVQTWQQNEIKWSLKVFMKDNVMIKDLNIEWFRHQHDETHSEPPSNITT